MPRSKVNRRGQQELREEKGDREIVNETVQAGNNAMTAAGNAYWIPEGELVGDGLVNYELIKDNGDENYEDYDDNMDKDKDAMEGAMVEPIMWLVSSVAKYIFTFVGMRNKTGTAVTISRVYAVLKNQYPVERIPTKNNIRMILLFRGYRYRNTCLARNHAETTNTIKKRGTTC
ncbi:hypothetical protein BGZ74_002999 [Mortierella antarctica]|nr:hypothetical protein BGZ74_002999 [Mortierella antarctica]